MATEIRRLRSDDDMAQYAFAGAYAFNSDRGEAGLARRTSWYEPDWCLGAFEDGRLVAGLAIIPFEQHMLGSRIPLGGIASVCCLPEYRRRGHVGALLRRALAEMRDAGQPLSALYTPHYSLYRKFGWELASRLMSYSFEPKVARARLPDPGGAIRRVQADDWRDLDALYNEFHAIRNGGVVRTEKRWREYVFVDEEGRGQRDAAVWANASGQARGYAVYRAVHRNTGRSPWGETTLRVHDWVALDGEAYAGILNFLLGHDLVDEIVMLASPDEPLPAALEEPVHIKQPPSAWFGIMLRVVDIERAITARPATSTSIDAAVTVAIHDATAPWNAGAWQISCAGGKMAAERTSAPAGFEIDAGALGPIYNGYLRPVDAVRVGAARASDPKAIDHMTRLFSVPFSPYCADDF